MANANLEKYVGLIKGLLPQGWAWRRIRERDSKFHELASSIAPELCRVEERGLKLFTEAICGSTFELLEDWERFLGIPDECTPDDYDPSLSERRARVCQKLTTKGSQNSAFFILLAEQLGYDTANIETFNYVSFRAGRGRAGDRLTNGEDWAYTWAITLPASIVRYFRAGSGSAGERLRIFSNEELECVVNKFKPAHTIVLFIYEE